MFGVGPGSLVYDADKLGIDPATQRRRLDEAVDVILALLRGETVNCETDWFSCTDAKLQMPNFTQPHIEMAVASARSPTGATLRVNMGSACWPSAAPQPMLWRHIAPTGRVPRNSWLSTA